MSDVFISYSRLDRDFVGQLRESLLAQDQEVWIDWEAIPPSQSWWDEIKKGIVKANNFVVVLSPNSMASPICQMEIEYARELHKRIIPIMHISYERESALIEITKRLAKKEETTTRQIWGNRQSHDLFDANDGELKHINYFFFSAEDDFQTKFNDLFAIIRTDYAHKEQHTTLELRAIEWDRRGRDIGFLLLDTELAQAQDWLAQSATKEPPPTQLQKEYIAESAKIEVRRHRLRQASIVAGVVAVISIIAVIASLLSLNDSQQQANDSNTQVVLANSQLTQVPPTLTQINEQISIIQRQANSANTQVVSANNILSQIPPTLNAGNTQVAEMEATGTLIAQNSRLLNYSNHANRIILSDAGNVETAALLSIYSLNIDYSPQSDYLLARSLDRLSTTRLILNNERLRIALSSRRSQYALVSDAQGMSLWNIITGTAVRRFENGDTFCVDLSPDNELSLSCGIYGVILWNTETGERLQEFAQDQPISEAIFSPDSRNVLIGYPNGSARLWEIESNSIVQEFIGGDTYIYDMAFSRDGSKISISHWNSSTIVWDIESGEEINRFSYVGSALSSDISPDGNLLVVSYGNFTVRLYDLNTGNRIRDFMGHSLRTMKVKFVSNSQLVTANEDGTARLWDVESGDIIRVFSGHTGGIYDMDVNNSTLITTSIDGSVRIWRLNEISWQHIVRNVNADTTGGVTSAFFSPDESYIITTSWSPELWDVQTNRHTVWYPFGDVQTVNFSSNGRIIVAGKGPFDGDPDPNYIQTFDTLTGDVIQTFIGHTGRIQEVLFLNNNRYIISASEDSTVRLWDTNTGEQLRVFRNHTGSVNSVAYSPDGRFIASGGDDTSVRIWDAQTGQNIRTLVGHTKLVNTVMFSPNGNYILTSSFDDTARLWDVETGMISRVYQGHRGDVNSASFSSDGQQVLTAGDDGTLRIWYTRWQDFVAYACTRVFRDFTDDERQEFGIDDDSPTCPQFATNDDA